ncbi:MAG: hypothetical protein JWP89_1318 [Schlesneria sp.]|nr:hypothetical protein [Schlesneria sp.]
MPNSMSTLRELENSIGKLPLAEQEALLVTLERRVAEGYDRLAVARVSADMRLIERHLAASPVTPEQISDLHRRVDAAERGEASYLPWEKVRQAVLDEIRQPK